MDKIDEIKSDIAELESLLATASRQKVKDILSVEIRKLVTQIVKLEEERNKVPSAPASSKPVVTTPKCYQVRLNNYAWDQTDKFVKFYVTLNNVQKIAPENVSCKFTNKSLELNVKNLDNKDYVLTINKLLGLINPEGSSWKIKTDMVIVSVAKEELIKWSHVTELEKRASEAKMAPYKDKDKSGDPTDGLMSMMKNMYEQGDDEMKRTIAKAWTEGQMKKGL